MTRNARIKGIVGAERDDPSTRGDAVPTEGSQTAVCYDTARGVATLTATTRRASPGVVRGLPGGRTAATYRRARHYLQVHTTLGLITLA